VRIGDAVELEIEDFAGAEEGTVTSFGSVIHPVNSTMNLAHATKSRIQAFGLDLDLTGKNGHSAPFAWQN